ncbi:MAG: cytochrome P450 [Chloroflexia bacterium]
MVYKYAAARTNNSVPGPPGPPYIGPVLPYLRDPLGFMLANYRRYGEVIRIELVGIRGVALHGAAAHRYVLVDAADNFVIAPLIDRLRARWIVGNGLLFIDDPAHRRDRRLIMPAFSRKRVEDYQEVMQETARQMLDSWVPGVEIDVAAEMHLLALTVVGRTLFNMDLAGSARVLGEAVAAVVHAASNPAHIMMARLPFDVPPIGVGGTLRKALARIDRVLSEVIERHIRDGLDAGDAVSMLVAARDEAGEGLTNSQIRDHLLTLFVAGHETSANALVWTFYLLAMHPEATRKLLSELDAQLGGKAPDAADLERLPYLDQVVKEGLRLYPPAASLNRIAREDFEWRGYTIPAGALISYSPFVSHRMPTQFRDPEVFRPERFDPLAGDSIPQYAYIPFGAGPRSCVGAPFATMEIKTVLAMALQRFRLDLVPNQRIEATVRTTLQPKRGIRMVPQIQDGHVERSPARVMGNVIGALPG